MRACFCCCIQEQIMSICGVEAEGDIQKKLESGDFVSALSLLDSLTRDQLSALSLPDACTPLHYACQHGRVDIAERLITDFQYGIGKRDAMGLTPLHTAAQYGQIETIKYFLNVMVLDATSELLSDVESDSELSEVLSLVLQQKVSAHQDLAGNTPLHTACIHGHLEVVKFLISEIGCDSNMPNDSGQNCLHLAAQHGHLSLVKYLLEKVVRSNQACEGEDKLRRSAVYLAAGQGHLEVVDFLIKEMKCDPNAVDSLGWTPLHAASSSGHLAVVKYLVNTHHSDPVSLATDKTTTPFILAASGGHLEVIRFYTIECRCDPFAMHMGTAPLHAAALKGHFDIVQFFMTVKDSPMDTVFHHAYDHNCYHLVNHLIDTHHGSPDGLDTNTTNSPQLNKLMEVMFHLAKFQPPQMNAAAGDIVTAAGRGDLKVVKHLAEVMNCDPNHRTRSGETALHAASKSGHLDVVKYLVDKHHCDPLCPDSNNMTPFHVAAGRGHLDIVEYFAVTCHCSLQPQKNQFTPLHCAIAFGRLDVVKFFIKTLNCEQELSKDGALRLSINSGNLDLVQYLVGTLHCDPMSFHSHPAAPLHLAASIGKLQILKFFVLDCQHDPQVRTKDDNSTPLHLAAKHGCLEVVKFLVADVKCKADSRNDAGETPLHEAARSGHLGVVKYLIESHGCDPRCLSNKRVTPLILASNKGRMEVVRYLTLDCHCQPQKRNVSTLSPFDVAILSGQLEVVKFYIEVLSCNPHVDEKGECTDFALRLAATQGHVDVVRYLVDTQHCDPLLAHNGHRSPLHVAASKGRLDVVKFFVDERHCGPGEAIYFAASEGHLEVVRFLLEGKKCKPDARNVDGETPLHIASKSGRLDVVQYLITKHHCDPHCLDNIHRTPMESAVQSGQLDTVKYFTLIHHCNPLRKIGVGKEVTTPVHLAVINGHLDVVKFFVNDMKCDPQHTSANGLLLINCASMMGHLHIVRYLVSTCHCDPVGCAECTSLHLASTYGKLDVLHFLVHDCHCDPQVKEESGNTPLHDAAAQGQLHVVKFLVADLQCDPCPKNDANNTPLHVASSAGHLGVVQYLLDTHHCDPLSMNSNFQIPFDLAAIEGHLDIVRYFLINQYCNPQADRPEGSSLHAAAKYRQLEVLKICIEEYRCNPNLSDGNGFTPLHHAAASSHLDVVRYLVEEQRCDPLYSCRGKVTSVHAAAAGGSKEVLCYFVDNLHCDLTCEDNDGATPLHYSALQGHLEAVQYLATADKVKRDNEGKTPLHYAAMNGHLEVVDFLVTAKKVDPNAACDSGMTPLHYAIANGHNDVSRYLIDLQECNVSSLKPGGISPMLFAVQSGNFEIVKYLVTKRGVDPYVHPEDRKQILQLLNATHNTAILDYFESYEDPLHLAAATGDVAAVLHYVEEEKWCPNTLDRHGNSVLHTASQYGQLEVVKLLTGGGPGREENARSLCDPYLRNKRGITAQEVARESGHFHIDSYLLRATTGQEVSKSYALSPSINILVLGNSGSGKSTLVKALSQEKGVLGKFVKVKVKPLTAGIIPTILHSDVFGRVNIYDFAGHEEYYASHELLLQQTAQPLVLIAIDISLIESKIKKQVSYWLSILSNYSSGDDTKTVHVIVIGSHADQVKPKVKGEIHHIVDSLMQVEPAIKYSGFIHCDCRYSNSDDMKQLRQTLSTVCRSVRSFITHHETDFSNRLSASLMHHIQRSKSEQVTITVSKLYEDIRLLKSPGPTLIQLVDHKQEPKLERLLEVCKTLSSNGHLLFLLHDQNIENSLLVLDENTILAKVHACLTGIKKKLTNKIGMLSEAHLKQILTDALGGEMEPELAIKYLLFTQFCTRVATDQLVPRADKMTGDVHYFFPNLVRASKPADLWTMGKHSYSHMYTWCLKSADDQFFTLRLLHTLFIQLVECESDTDNTKYIIWKNGILLVHNNGTRSMIEVTDQTTHIYLVMQCIRKCEGHLVRQRSKYVSLVRSLLDKICPKIRLEEFLLLPQSKFPAIVDTVIPIAELARSVVNGHSSVSYERGSDEVPQHALVSELLHFDPFHALGRQSLQDIFANRHSENSISREIYKSLASCKELVEIFQDDESEDDMKMISFNQLYEKLTHYSIFADRNIYELANIELKKPADLVEIPSAILNKPVGIDDLYRINVELVSIMDLWWEFGIALGVEQDTLKATRINYHHSVNRQFTETLANWLKGVSDTSGPKWEDAITALKSPSIRKGKLALQIAQKIAGKSENQPGESGPYISVSNAILDQKSLPEVCRAVAELDHSWFYLGLALGLRYSTLCAIESSNRGEDVRQHMTHTLHQWLKQVDLDVTNRDKRRPPSWRALAVALDCPLVGEMQVASKIKSEHQI